MRGRPLIVRALAWGALCWHAAAWGQASDLFTDSEKAWIATHPVVTVAINADWRPLEYIEGGVYKGLSAEYLKKISSVSGLEFRWTQVMDWASARAALLDGTIGLLPASSERLASPQLRDRIAFSAPYFVGATLIVTQADAPVMFDPRQLSGKKVAVKGGGAYERNLRARYPTIDLVPVDNPKQALEMVSENQVYAAVDVDAAFIPLMQQYYYGKLHVAGAIADMPAVVSIGVRREEAVLMSIIDKSLASLTAAETDRMIAKWVDSTSYGQPGWTAIMRYYFWELVIAGSFLATFVFLMFHAYKAKRHAEHIQRDKAMLLAVMSHEIRTPMNAILSSVELLARTERPAADAQLAKVAITSANTLLELLDSVLDFSKLEAERLILNYEPTDIRGLIEDAVRISEFRAQEKNLPLKTYVRWTAPLWLSVDALRVRQVLINLLSNAIKFTDTGEVSITADFFVSPQDAAKGTLHIAIKDTGIGISKRNQQRLFQAFTQADESVTRKFGGTGLGLTICRQLLFLMGGTVALHSEQGKGTTIEVRLPLWVAEPQHPGVHGDGLIEGRGGIQPAQPAPASTSGLSVLVIEDHPDNQFVIKCQLQLLGHETTQALTGQGGLDEFVLEAFDIILLDCNLPDIDGYTVATRIREVEKGTGIHTPIIAISAMVGPEHRQSCFDAGIDGLLSKPLRIDQLREIIDLWCDVEPSPTAQVASYDSDDADLQKAFLATCLQDLEDIRRHADARDWRCVGYSAHRIVGAALMLMQLELANAARRVETLAAEGADSAIMDTAIDALQGLLGAKPETGQP